MANTASPLVDVVWRPLPPRQVNNRWIPSSQAIALASPCNETLYCGTRGPGKTDAQLMYFAQYVGKGFGAYWKGIVLDMQEKSLDALFERAEKWYRKIWGKQLKVYSSAGLKGFEWPSGEQLLFRICATEKQYWAYHGEEFPFIAWNELTKWKDNKCYQMFLSTNRSSWDSEPAAQQLGPIPLRVFSTTNSYGIGFRWVKNYFIVPAPYGVPIEDTQRIFSAKLQKEIDVVRTRVAIFGSYKENPYLDDKTIAFYASITNPNLRKSWLEGSWDIAGGGIFDDLWASHIHVKPRFKIPKGWFVDRTFDWANAEPFSIGWHAVADGTEAILEDGRVFAPKRGSIIQCNEWYGAKDIEVNEGLNLSVSAMCDGIKNREMNMMNYGWLPIQPQPGPADNQIRQVRDQETETLEKMYANNGIKWTESNKSPGSRVIGVGLFRERLENSLKGEGPGFYVMDNCRATLAIVPNLARDEDNIEDVDSNAIDHPWDMLRYKILRNVNRSATKVPLRVGY